MREITIRLENFNSYADQTIDLGSAKGPVLISGRIEGEDPGHSNGSGKSSLIEAIVWSLFGASRARSDDDLIRQGQEQVKVTNVFEIDGSRYEVVRSRKRGKSQSLTFTDLTLDMVMRGNSVRETQDKIMQVLGINYNTFSQTVYSPQKGLDLFPASLPSERKELLGAILGIGQYAEIEDRARALAAGHERDAQALALVVDRTERELVEDGVYPERVAAMQLALDRVNEQLAVAVSEHEKGMAAIQTLQAEAQEQRRLRDDVENAKLGLGQVLERLLRVKQEHDKQVADLNNTVGSAKASIACEPQFRADLVEAQAMLDGHESLSRRLSDLESQSQIMESQAAVIQSEITARATALATARQSLDRLTAQEQYAEADRKRQLDDVEAERRQLMSRESREEPLRRTIAEVESKIRDYEQVRESLERLRADHAVASSQRDGLKREIGAMAKDLDKLRHRLHQVSSLGNRCPTCYSELTPEAQQKIIADIVTEGTAQKAVYEGKLAEMVALEARLVAGAQEVKELSDSMSRRPELQADLQRYRDELAMIDIAKSQLKEMDQRKISIIASCEHRSSEIADERAQHMAVVTNCESAPDRAHEVSSLRARSAEALTEVARGRLAGSDREVLVRKVEQARLNLGSVEAARAVLGTFESQLATARQTLEQRSAECQAETDIWSARIRDSEEGLRAIGYEEGAMEQAMRRAHEARERVDGLLVDQTAASAGLAVARSLVEAQAKKKAQLEADRRRARQSLDQQFVYQELTRAFGRNGIPALILDNALAEVQAEVNQMMDRLTQGRIKVQFETQKDLKSGRKAETLDIVVSDSLGSRDYAQYSGGEGARVALAIRLALSKVVSRRAGKRIDLVIIDEVSDLDPAGVDAFASAIMEVGRDHQVFVVSHLESLSDRFSDRIMVVKGRDGSYIEGGVQEVRA